MTSSDDVRKSNLWPWDRELPPPNRRTTTGSSLPKISIATPSYNQGEFIEETILSVLLQDYPNIEYFVNDGGSTDNSLWIIEKYSPWISSWVSEIDNGQAHAVNKGWAQASGEILGWLNSDDLLAPNALKHVASRFQDDPNCVAVIGKATITYRDLTPAFVKDAFPMDPKRILRGANIPAQPAVFIHRTVFGTLGGLDESFHYKLDREYWARLSLAYTPNRFQYIDEILAIAREYPGNKSSSGGIRQARERLTILDRAFSNPNLSQELAALRNEAYGRTKFRIASTASLSGQPFHAWQAALSSWRHEPTISNLFRVLLLCAKAASPYKRTRHPLYARTSKRPK